MTYTPAEYKKVLNEALVMLDEPDLQESTVSMLNQALGLDKLADAYFAIHSR